jgi:hypothetical protein
MLDCRALEHEIQGHAVWQAGRVRILLAAVKSNALGGHPVAVTLEPSRIIFGPAPVVRIGPLELRSYLDEIASTGQARPIPKKTTLSGAIARMTCAGWWKRNLRKTLLRGNETVEHGAGLIHKTGQVYVSDHAAKMARLRDKANQTTLEGLEVVSQEGEALNLWDVAQASISNPALRRAELMTRCRGFEEAAEFMGHKGVFLTFTCPKRFHRVDHRGQAVTKWDGSTPKDAQQYLCKIWSRIRAGWKKLGIVVYGFRVAEPHQDGTPHWHMLLFCDASQVRDMLSIAAKHAMAQDRNESGARQHRFTVKRIDPAKGSATGYIAKYICKNIDGTKEDGQGMGLDDESGEAADIAARRVRVWASTWGIRQFQQIGGPSVTVWRELRRLGEDAQALQLELFEKPRAAASRGAWFDFWMVQGGPEVARRDLSIKPLYVPEIGAKYGDEIKVIKGVQDAAETVGELTRLKTWTVQRAGLDAVNEIEFAFKRHLEFTKTNAAFLQAYEDAEFKRIGEAERTRTGVNNCNPDPFAPFDFSGFPETEAQEFAPDHPQEVKNDVLHPVTGLELWQERLIADENDTREAIEQATAEENRQARAWGRPTMDKATARRALRAHWSIKKWNTPLLNPCK